MRGRIPIVPQRRRQIPPQFSWLDHRLVRDGHVQKCGAPALALYLFLVTVSDVDGLSWYSERALCGSLSLTVVGLDAARSELCRANLIAYQHPLYQVLDLSPTCPPATHRQRGSDVVPVGAILQRLMGGSH